MDCVNPERNSALGDVLVVDSLIGQTSNTYCARQSRRQRGKKSKQNNYSCLGSGAGKPEDRHLKNHSTIVD